MSIFNFLTQKKFTREPREWQFFTSVAHKDYELKTKSPYEKFDDEGYQLWNHVLIQSNRNMSNYSDNKEIFTQGNSKNLVIYLYHFRDGRKDKSNRDISSYLILKLTPEEASKYTIKDFANEIYSKKSSLRILYPTGFDLADKFPVQWDDTKPMESHDKNFLKTHPNSYEDDFAFQKEEFEIDNKTWQNLKKENATFLSTTFYPEKPKNK